MPSLAGSAAGSSLTCEPRSSGMPIYQCCLSMCEQIALKFALTGCIGKKRLFTELVVTGQKESVIDDISLCRDRQTVQLILVTVAIKIAIHLEDVRNHCLIVYLCSFQHHDIRFTRVKCGETRALRKTALSCVAACRGAGARGAARLSSRLW